MMPTKCLFTFFRVTILFPSILSHYLHAYAATGAAVVVVVAVTFPTGTLAA